MIYSILYILLNVTLYIDIGVARALYVAVAAHSRKNINILLRASLCAPYFVTLSTRSVILNAVKNLLKADQRQPALIARIASERLPWLVPSLAMTVDSV